MRTSTPELNLRRIAWIFEAREQMLEFNVPVALALESMMVALKAARREPRGEGVALVAGRSSWSLLVVGGGARSPAPRAR